MARRPRILAAFGALNAATADDDNTAPAGVLAMVGNIANQAAGCRYCVAHVANNAGKRDVEADRIAALWQYETSPLFSDAERAALRFAQKAASMPNMVTDQDADAVKAHFGVDGVVEILATVRFYGVLNR
jgi:alkylhydroperoxidase family enzyme